MLYVDDASPGNKSIVNNNKNNRHLASCSVFDGNKWGCASAGGTCSYNKKTKQCTGELDGGGSDGDVYVSDAAWVDQTIPTRDGDVHEAAGRLYFVSGGDAYWCSATAITDGDVNNDGITTADTSNGRSLILTAAHCVFDEVSDEVSSILQVHMM